MAHPTQANVCIVSYSADLVMKGYVPGFVTTMLQKTALKSAVSWVKKHSEAQWTADSLLPNELKGKVSEGELTTSLETARRRKRVMLGVLGASAVGSLCYKSRGWFRQQRLTKGCKCSNIGGSVRS